MMFSFDGYEIDGQEVRFKYGYKEAGAEFIEKLVFPFEIQVNECTKNILKYLHLLLGVSYFKSLLGEIEIPYQLSQTEAEYLNTVYHQGLGEFAYVNQITEDIRPFAARDNATSETVSIVTNGALLGIGGGKDSIVAGEILKQIGIPTTAFMVGSRDHHGQADAVVELLQIGSIPVERHIDTGVIEFTKSQNRYNGHVPLSALLAWIGIFIAGQQNLRYVIVANESGSSEDNTVWNGRKINHQWSKSLEFESLTQDFVHRFVSPDITYFSLIRPFSSIKIIELLTKTGDKYLGTFTSCNLVLRIDPEQRPNGRWCGKCPKCLSTFLLLTAFLPYSKVIEIFGSDLLEDDKLNSMMRELVGLEGHKPLDCVGTIDELRAVTRKLLENSVSKKLLENINPDEIPGPTIEKLSGIRSEHRLPEEFIKILEL